MRHRPRLKLDKIVETILSFSSVHKLRASGVITYPIALSELVKAEIAKNDRV